MISYIAPLLISAALSMIVSLHLGRGPSSPGLKPFRMALFAIVGWNLTYAASIASSVDYKPL
jgi:hypothetical protein